MSTRTSRRIDWRRDLRGETLEAQQHLLEFYLSAVAPIFPKDEKAEMRKRLKALKEPPNA